MTAAVLAAALAGLAVGYLAGRIHGVVVEIRGLRLLAREIAEYRLPDTERLVAGLRGGSTDAVAADGAAGRVAAPGDGARRPPAR